MIVRNGRPTWSPRSLLALLLCSVGCSSAPRMGPDRDVFKTVDALYTAVSLREPGQVSRCASTLTDLHQAGKLPADAHSSLEAIIRETEAGRWEPAQTRLRDFMLAQRGE